MGVKMPSLFRAQLVGVAGVSATAAIGCFLGLSLIGFDDGGHRFAAESGGFGNLSK